MKTNNDKEIIKAIISIIEKYYLFTCVYDEYLDLLRCEFVIDERVIYYRKQEFLKQLKDICDMNDKPPYDENSKYIKSVLFELNMLNQRSIREYNVNLLKKI